MKRPISNVYRESSTRDDEESEIPFDFVGSSRRSVLLSGGVAIGAGALWPGDFATAATTATGDAVGKIV